jgi:hypothetical protein
MWASRVTVNHRASQATGNSSLLCLLVVVVVVVVVVVLLLLRGRTPGEAPHVDGGLLDSGERQHCWQPVIMPLSTAPLPLRLCHAYPCCRACCWCSACMLLAL